MKRRVLTLSLTFVVGISLGIIGGQVLNAQQEPVKRTVLQKVDLGDKEGVMFLAEIAPGATAGKHYHPGYEFFYTLEGSWIFQPEGKSPVTLKAGDVGHNPPKQVHGVTNASKTAPAKILGFLIAEKGQPMTTTVK